MDRRENTRLASGGNFTTDEPLDRRFAGRVSSVLFCASGTVGNMDETVLGWRPKVRVESAVEIFASMEEFDLFLSICSWADKINYLFAADHVLASGLESINLMKLVVDGCAADVDVTARRK
mmetsp:Transcript_44340/g.135121  ORF Transcript_44340/g.135121 Transcript_44340/m.135121 type:complete len:121 (-) Transcript_44340:5-367(-)